MQYKQEIKCKQKVHKTVKQGTTCMHKYLKQCIKSASIIIIAFICFIIEMLCEIGT